MEAFPRGQGWATFIGAVLTSGVLLGICFLLFGTAMLRAAVLPRWAAALAIIGGISQGISFLLPRPIAAIGGIAFGAGLVGLSHGLWNSTPGGRSARPGTG
ncbi:hypothetical protein BH23ACT12_BH23ACT12_20630 [soil metagenome]